MTSSTPITVAYGDGIGPEIMEAVLKILRYARASVSIETIEVGQKLYERGYSSGIPETAWESIKRTKILLKAPITTPQGGGYKSLNVTMRGALGLYANIRPCVAYHPYVKTHHPDLNVVIIRENEEDLYTGIEYRQTHNVFETLKLISRTGSERIIRYAFEYAVRNNRKKVSCFSKDNIMKMTDGVFHQVFNEVAKEYPQITTDHYIIDIGSARLANKPEIFDVIVTSNLYGDIISDIAAEVSGSVGLAGSSNIGAHYAMFEAIHGSAPDIAGKDIANPSGLLQAAVMMLVHIGDTKAAEYIHNAWLRTLEDGIHTGDIYNTETSRQKVGTQEFADAVIKRIGSAPTKMAAVRYVDAPKQASTKTPAIRTTEKKKLVGVDVFVAWMGDKPEDLASRITSAISGSLKLQLITQLGLKVWPGEAPEVNAGDHWRLRFTPGSNTTQTTHQEIVALLGQLITAEYDVVKTENLYVFDDTLGFSLAQGE